VVTADHVSTEKDNAKQLKEIWTQKVKKICKKIGPYRSTLEDHSFTALENPGTGLEICSAGKTRVTNGIILAITHELIERHWYLYLLQSASSQVSDLGGDVVFDCFSCLPRTYSQPPFGRGSKSSWCVVKPEKLAHDR